PNTTLPPFPTRRSSDLVWLGMTVRCAQCHDHKYDPIKQKDFYQILAYFNRARETDIDAPLPGELDPYQAAKPEYDRKRAELFQEDRKSTRLNSSHVSIS